MIICEWKDPDEIHVYAHPKDPYGNPLTGHWVSVCLISQNELSQLLNDGRLEKMDEDDGDGISGTKTCYRVLRR